MRELLSPSDPDAQRAPLHVREKAADRREPATRILHIVWGEEEGYPEASWGFEQWSVRRYRVGQGCDGTIEDSMHFVAIHLFAALGLDYPALYQEAYPGESLDGWPAPDQLTWLIEETEMPPLTAHTMDLLLHDLYDTNHRTLEELLRERLESLGFLPTAPPCANPSSRDESH